MVFGVDLHFDSVMAASELILVGRAGGKLFSADYIMEWIQVSWSTAPYRDVEAITLTKGWFMVTLKNAATLEWVLAHQWGFGIAPILFKRWTPLFDVNRERVDEIPVWVCLPALPPHVWIMEVIREIGNNLGTFLKADMSF